MLWLWRRPEAISLIRPAAWEPPYVAGAAPKRQKKKKIINNHDLFILLVIMFPICLRGKKDTNLKYKIKKKLIRHNLE